MTENQKSLNAARAASWALKDELGQPKWLKDVVVDHNGSEYVLLMLISGAGEAAGQCKLDIRNGFRGFKVEANLVSLLNRQGT